jgi:hypothetical protein
MVGRSRPVPRSRHQLSHPGRPAWRSQLTISGNFFPRSFSFRERSRVVFPPRNATARYPSNLISKIQAPPVGIEPANFAFIGSTKSGTETEPDDLFTTLHRRVSVSPES